jgi:hypothetical protein
MDWKYIIVFSHGVETPILFPEWIGHAEVAGERKVIAAGLVRLTGGEQKWDTIVSSNEIQVKCFGRSPSLKVNSRGGEDAFLIQSMFRSALNMS